MDRRVTPLLKSSSSHPIIHSSANVKQLHLFPPRPHSHNVPLGEHHHHPSRLVPPLHFIPSFIFISPLNRHSLASLSLSAREFIQLQSTTRDASNRVTASGCLCNNLARPAQIRFPAHFKSPGRSVRTGP